MARLKSLRTFPFKSMLVILGVFLMIAVVLFAERSGIQYAEKNRKVAYLSQEEVVTEQMAAKSLPKTCLVLRNSEDAVSYTHLDVYKRQVGLEAGLRRWIRPWMGQTGQWNLEK